MSTTTERVLAESRSFRSQLPQLLPVYDGRWVVFREGGVKAVFEDEESAYVAAVERFGVRGGFVVAQVSASACDPIPVFAAGLVPTP